MSEVSALVAGINSTVSDNATDISVYTADGKYVYVNESWIEHTGVLRALGKRLPELHILPPDQLVKYLAEDQEVLEHKTLVVIDQYDVNALTYSAIIIRAVVALKENVYIVVVTTHVDMQLITPELADTWESLSATKARLLAAKLLTLSSKE